MQNFAKTPLRRALRRHAASATIRSLFFLGLIQAPLLSDMAKAADPSAELVDALRQRGWNDTAVQYVDWIEQSPLATDEFRVRLPYEQAVARAALGKQGADLRRRSELLSLAIEGFSQTAARTDDLSLALDALRQAANLSAERAIVLRSEAERTPSAASRQRERLLVDSRASFAESSQFAQQLAELCRRELANMPKPAMLYAEPEARQLLDVLRSRTAEAGFLIPLVQFELAGTYPEGSSDWKQSLSAALRDFDGMRQQYDGSLVGVSSQFYVGRCQQLLGQLEAAIESFEKVIGKPVSTSEFRRWTARAHRRRAECLVSLGDLDQAIRDSENWLETAPPEDRKRPEWLAASFRLAEAYLAKANERSQPSANNRRLVSQARLLMREVAGAEGEFQQQAKVSLASFRGDSVNLTDYETFEDAFAAGKSALEVSSSSKLAARLARENNPDAVDDLQQRAVTSRKEALELFQLALSLADERSPDLDVQAARYFLCFLNWELGRLQESAELGETIAREFAGSEYARPAAKVALSAYDQLYRQAATEDEAQELRDRLRGIARLIAQRWPDSKEATAAVSLLIALALEENQLESAENMLNQLPAAGRAAGELSLGSALWTQYIRSVSDDPKAADDAAKLRAGQLLASGYDGVRSAGNATAANATGVLYYAQLLLGQGEAERAVDVLQDPTVGPLTLVTQGRFEDRADLQIETYKAALRAFLALSPPRRDAAQEMIEALERTSASSGRQQDLTSVYVSLGLQLEQQIRELNAANRTEQARALAGAFEDVLSQLASRPEANDWRIQNWLARTYLQMGELLEGEQADAMIDLAEKQFRAILQQTERDKDFAPNYAAVLGVSKQLADCRLAIGKYKEALNEYVRILRQKPALLELQIASAAALQRWGVAEKRVGALDQAIGGALPQQDGKNLIWGWIRLAQVVEAAKRRVSASDASTEASEQATRYENIFYQARYNAALARFQSSQMVPATEKASQLRTVKQSLTSLKALYPDLGGPRWKPRFEKLMQQVDQQL